jgi:hypothetical protein
MSDILYYWFANKYSSIESLKFTLNKQERMDQTLVVLVHIILKHHPLKVMQSIPIRVEVAAINAEQPQNKISDQFSLRTIT